MTDEYRNFDAVGFYSKHCGPPLRKEGKETLFKCPKCNGKNREIYVAPAGQWNCKHAKCAAELGCLSQKGGPRQFLSLIEPGIPDPEAFEELNKFGRNSKNPLPEKAKTEKKKTWKTLDEMSTSMPKWSNITSKIGSTPKVSGVWHYHHSDGKPSFAVIRLDGSRGKIYMQAHPVSGGWQIGGIESGRPLYRLPAVPKDFTIPVIVVEGEKSADALQKFLNDNRVSAWATTPSQGAQSPQKTDWGTLKGRTVTILPDNDDAGKKFAQDVARLAKEAGATAVMVAQPFGESGTGFDVADEIQRGSDPAAILNAITNAKEPGEDEQVEGEEINPALTIEASSCIRFFENDPQPREFIVSDFLPRLNVGVIAAPGGTGKGYLTLQLALSVATGIKFLGKFDIEKSGGVLYCNAEDDEPEIHRRFLGCLKEVLRGVAKDKAKEAAGALGERFYAPSLTGKQRLTLYPDDKGVNKRGILNLARLIPDLRLIILDPANRIMAGDFNRVEEVTAFIQTLEEIATETRATILLVTHTNKSSQSGDRDSKHSASAVLGSQSFVNAARWVMTLSTFDESMRRKLQFTGSLERFVSLRIPKANYLAPGLGELHLERVTDDSDETGLGSGPLRLVNLGKKEKEVTQEEVAQTVQENPGLRKTALIDVIKGKFGVPLHKTRTAVDEALKNGFIKEVPQGSKNRKVIEPNFITEPTETETSE